jgi:hypothetical protein
VAVRRDHRAERGADERSDAGFAAPTRGLVGAGREIAALDRPLGQVIEIEIAGVRRVASQRPSA